LIEDEIAAYVPNDRGRLRLDGEAVWLTPKAFSTLALVVHELVTNSCKYGALSSSGRVVIDAATHEGDVRIVWQELNGPLVSAPTRRGFGSVIIERTIPFDLGGRASVEYQPSGLLATFSIPGSHIAKNTEAAAKPPGPLRGSLADGPASLPLQDLRVLLLEDNFIVALEAEELLRELGAAAVFAASRVVDAMVVLDREEVHFAMLDINLGHETSDAVAFRLGELAVPYILASGYDEAQPHTGKDAEVALVTKPFDRDELAAAITRTLSRIR
jgi:CheY-like chemotaxis protein